MSEIVIPGEEKASDGAPGKGEGAKPVDTQSRRIETRSKPFETQGKLSLGARVFQNTAAQLGGRVIGIFFSAGTSILLARYLGQEKLGEYGAIYAYLSLYGFFATFCLEQILAREISVRRHQAAEIFHTARLTALGFSLLGTLMATVAAPLFGYAGGMR